MKVKLLEYTPNPEKVISMAAKLCYSPVGLDGIEEKLTKEETERFVKMLINLGHESPIEHVNFTFGVEGISRACTHQLVRHRLASYSQQSQRYVKLDQFEFIVPKAIEKNQKAKEKFIEAMNQDQENYQQICKILQKDYEEKEFKENFQNKSFEDLSEEDLKKWKKIKSQIQKKSIEDARYVFPNACETKIVFTMNARNLLHFFHKRCCMRAQWEIREMAIEMLRQVKKVSPIIFSNAGPECVSKSCPEGSMSCMKPTEMKEKFKNL